MIVMLCLLIALVLIIAGLIGFVEMRNRKMLYTKDSCSICKQETGVHGNKRFVFKDGCVCESCLEKAGYSTKDMGPALFKSDSTQKIKEELDLKAKLSPAEWQEHLDNEVADAIAKFETENSKESVDAVRCPKCGSTQISADKKGFGVGKAAVGAYVAGPIGLVAGNIGAKKVRITCLKCGHQWTAGKE